MLPRSPLPTLPGLMADRCDESADHLVSIELRVVALEAELARSQRLVCHLLEKNERLRLRLRSHDQQLEGCVRCIGV